MDESYQVQQVCSDCGAVYPRDETRTGAVCPSCKPPTPETPNKYTRGSSSRRGYGWTWRKLSERARRLSPVCEDCGSPYDLTADHSERAWKRHAEGKTIRLEDVAVVCRRCNSERGAARGANVDHVRWETPTMEDIAHELAADPGEEGRT